MFSDGELMTGCITMTGISGLFWQKTDNNNGSSGEHNMKKSFSWRILISFGLFLSFFMILTSGVMLYIGPSGRGPGATGWSMIGLTKPEWQNQHIIFGFAFSLMALFHLFLINWYRETGSLGNIVVG
jgi:hypothetical protein